jgi:hypothetical protein
MGYKRTICVDFDGVIHWYRQGWNEGAIYDEPTPGAIDWLREMTKDERFEVAIYSSRSKDDQGVDSMRRWLLRQGLEQEVVQEILFPTKKPAAWLTIDDRCFEFRGLFPTVDYLLGYTPWMKVHEADQVKSDLEFLRALARDQIGVGQERAGNLTAKRLEKIADRLEGLDANA